MTSHAQIPTAGLVGLPATPLLGESFCTDVSFTNSGGATGFGPYLLLVIDAGITGLTADFVDIAPPLTQIGTFDASGTLLDPVTGDPITGNAGGTAWIARYPVGSVDQGQPALVMTLCATVEPGAEIGTPKPFEITPGFEFGNTTTGTNGPIVGTPQSPATTVTPELARISKANTAPESERPPGPSHPFLYRWSADISEGVSLDNVVVSDVLPPQIQWTGGAITIAAPLGTGCSITSPSPNPNPTPPPVVTVTATCASILGSANTADFTVSVPVYIADVLDETLPDSEGITNTVNFAYDYLGAPFADSATSTVTAEHAAVQKSVSGTGLPGGRLTYVFNFQLTDYPDTGTDGANTFTLSDTLADGLGFDGTVALVIDGVIVPISATATLNPASGETALLWDIAAAAGGQLNNGSQGSLTFEATILEDYADGSPVQASDGFENNVTLSYALTSGGSGTNDSAITAPVEPNVPNKTIFSPNPLPSALEPGQEVVFELSLSIPAGNTGNVNFIDFLPRPVFSVADFNAATDVSIQPPFETLTPTITTLASNNSVSFAFGDIDTDIASTLRVRLTARLVGTPFADSLFLTNLLQTNYETSDGRTITDLQAVGATIGAPSLAITKGVIAAANPNAMIIPAAPSDPTQATADSDVNGVDAFDELTYLVTVENVGTTPAYNVTIDDPGAAGLSCAEPAAGDIRNGNGSVLAFTGTLGGGLVLDARLDGNDGSEGAPYAGDTALLTLRCTLAGSVEPRQTIVNEAGVTWTSTPDPATPFTRISETANAVIADPRLSKTVTAITPGYSTGALEAHIGELVTYQLVFTVPEGTSSSVRVQDILPSGMAFADVVSIVASSGDLSSSVGSFEDVRVNNAGFNNQGGGETAPDRRLVFGPGNNDSGFGTITNSNANNGVAETLTITYRAKVLNAAVNVSGQQRRNQADWLWQTAGASQQSIQVRAAAVRIVEARLQLAKTFSPDTGDSSTPPLVTLRLNHASGSTADAFDVALSDLLPDNMRVDGVIDTSSCPALPDTTTVTDAGLSDSLEAQWARFPEGSTCTLRFQTRFTANPAAGSAVQNCAESFWESLRDSDQPLLPNPPNNTLGVERTGNTADAGQLNNYQLQSCDTFNVFGVGIEKIVTSSDQAHTDNIAGTPPDTESLTIGETVTFELILTIPDADIDNLEVTDLLPVTSDVLELVSATATSVGSDLTPTIPVPVAVISDRDGDGINDSAVLNYGRVIQLANGITDDNDRIRITVVAKVRDVLVNENTDRTVNTGIVRFLPSITASDTAALELVEPLLAISKTADASEAEAGDVVTYTLSIQHAPGSRIDARDLELSDLLPPALNVLPGDVSVGGTCTATPTTGPALAAGEITASWTSFPLGAVCEIEFLATVDVAAVIGQNINNEAEIRWTSLDTQGDADDREYDLQDTWVLAISEPGIAKRITAVNYSDFVLGTPSQNLTIGETVTFTIDADFPDGTTEQAFVSDRMPSTGVAFEIIRTEVIAIGGDLSIGSGVSVGDAAANCSASVPQTCAEWSLGDVINTPDNRPDPDADDRITFEIDAIVLDNPLNTGAPGEDKNLQNRAQLRSNSVNVISSARFDLTEPLLQISKLTENGERPAIIEASQRKRFTLRVAHLASSTAAAREISVTDVLNADMLWVTDSGVTSNCPGFSITSSPPDGTNGTVVFAIDELTVVEGSCDISYEVEAINVGFPVPDDFPNVATLDWESAPGSSETREGTDTDSNFLVSISSATVGKVVAGTSVPATRTGQGDVNLEDTTIGEEIRYEIVLSFSEGQQNDVVLTDTLQADAVSGPRLDILAGLVTPIGGNVIFVGDNITTSLAGTPSVVGNVVTVNFGTVDNFADGVLDEKDTIVYELFARVTNVAGNVAGTGPTPNTLTNTAALSFDGGSAAPVSVDVEIVEPILTATKTFTDLTEGVATLELAVTNTGTANAYELEISDEFPETLWLAGTLTGISVPPGFTLTENTAAGITTVTLTTLGNPARPEQVLAPGETITVQFAMELINEGIVGVPRLSNVADVQATSLPGVNPQERIYTTSATDDLLFPDLSLEKTWSAPATPVRPGDIVTYTLTLENAGDGAATNVVITDTPDAIGEFQAGSATASGTGIVTVNDSSGSVVITVNYASVAGGSTETISYEVQIPLPYPDSSSTPEQLSNQASVDAKEQAGIVSDDPSTGDPDDATLVPVSADPVMSIVKDDQLALTAPGNVIEYLIEYGNVGNQDATGVLITETVPANTVYTAANSSAGWSCADGSGPGTSCTFTVGNLSLTPGSVVFAVLVDTPLPPAVTQIDNTVSITDDGQQFVAPGDPPITPTPSTASDTEQTPIGGAFPQLRIEKDDGGIGVTPGQRYSYLIDYRNIGNQGATGVVISETVPEDVAFSAVASLPSRWSCPDGSPPGTSCSITVPLLLANASDSVRFGLDVNFPAAAGRELIINNVDISDDGSNSLTPSTDMDTDDTPLIAVPDIYVTKQTDATTVNLGDNIVYMAVYGNRGNQNATGVIVREAVPVGSTFNAANSAPTAWSCSNGAAAGTICEYLGGAVNVGFMETLMFSIDIVDTPGNREILNVIEANDDMSNGPDPVPTDNIARVLNRFPALSVDIMSRGALILLSLMLVLAAARQRRLTK
ncbi:MAG: hypothetical protein NWP69_01670 [Congregibacter sp.]|nr:hypothetical protein [Congregibacter sp.]